MTTPDTWVTTYRRIEQHHLPGMYCGRNVRHDSRNRAYPWRRSQGPLTSQLWPRHIGILDQADVGSCTGEEEVGALGTGPLWDALTAAERMQLTQALAYKIYSAAETLDGDGPYPPQDNGSSGPSAAQAAKNLGLISGYLHCFSLADVLDALETGPVGIGSNWYEGMDNPDSTGLVKISGSVRGGHEYLCRGKDVSKQLVFLDNSWGTGWGSSGSFSYSYATLERLLAEQGDGTVSLPLTVTPPAPVPVPVPPGPDTNPDDDALALAITNWSRGRHTGSNAQAAKAVRAWLHAKGFTA